MPLLILLPTGLESLILDGLDLNPVAGALALEQLTAPPPAKRPEWAQGADADGSLLVRDPLFENRTVTIRLRVNPQATMDDALAQVLALSAKLEETEQHPDGLPLTWSPANSSKIGTFYVLSGSITSLPISAQGDDAGWFVNSPVVTIELTCKPFMYGTPVIGPTASGSGQLLTVVLADVPGDVAAEGRLIVTDGASQSRRYLEWGLEQRYYNPAAPLQLQSSALDTIGCAGASATRAGSVNTNVVRATLAGLPVAIATTGVQPHVGMFRVKARVYASSSAVQARLSWQDGDGSLHSNVYTSIPQANAFSEIDLGLVTINPASLGAQKWLGRIEAYTSTPGDTLDVDYVMLIPAGEGYGKARGTQGYDTPSAYSARDEFAQSAGALAGKTAPLGGNWAGAGSGTDFAVETTGHTAQRTATDGVWRYATLPVSMAATTVQADIKFSALSSGGTELAVIARYIDTSNYLRAQLQASDAFPGLTGDQVLFIESVVAGTTTYLGAVSLNPGSPSSVLTPGTVYTLRLTVDSDGRAFVWFFPKGSLPGNPIVVGSSPDLATGGALASGKPGIADYSDTACIRNYANFAAFVPSSKIVINSGRTVEVRSDGVQRQDSTGTYYGPVPAYRGSRLLIPPAGDKDRTSRIAVKAHRNDIEIGDDTSVTDALTAQVIYTPRFIAVPG